mgnify:CR=1 FL=1
MSLTNHRNIYFLLLISVIGMVGYALYSEKVLGLVPCALCMTQRIFYCLVGFFALLALIHSQSHRLYALFMALSAVIGASVAGRQVWLQHLPPDQVPACGPSLEYMLNTFPFAEALKMLLLGDGNCAEVVWRFIGLSMAEWSLIGLTGLAAASLWQALRRQ